MAQIIKNLPAVWETWVQSLGREDSPGGREWLPTLVFLPGEFHGAELDTTEKLTQTREITTR